MVFLGYELRLVAVASVYEQMDGVEVGCYCPGSLLDLGPSILSACVSPGTVMFLVPHFKAGLKGT